MVTKIIAKKTTSQVGKQSELAGKATPQAVKEMMPLGSKHGRLMGLPTPSTDLVGELNSIDFKNMIGGPLQATVDAQIASSMATIDFIKTVCFEESSGNAPVKLVMVDFTHTKPNIDPLTGVVSTATPTIETKLQVPLIALVQVPSLRIEHVTVDFNVKLTSVQTATVSTDINASTDVSVKTKKVNFKVSASFQRKTAASIEVKKEYSLSVSVKAVQDELPPGLEKVLNLLGG